MPINFSVAKSTFGIKKINVFKVRVKSASPDQNKKPSCTVFYFGEIRSAEEAQ